MTAKHTPASYDDAPELLNLIKRFAQVEDARYGKKLDTGPEGIIALQEILHEIDETMLPRRILISCHPGGTFDLIVSNRRLLAVEAAGVPSHRPARTPKEAAAGFASVLRVMIEKARWIIMNNPQPITSYSASDLSVSTALLSHALGLSDFGKTASRDEVTPPAPFTGIAIAQLRATSDLCFSDIDGPEAETEALKAFWRAYITSTASERRQNQISAIPKMGCLFPIDDSIGIAVMTDDQQVWHLALVPKASFQDLRRAWAADCASP